MLALSIARLFRYRFLIAVSMASAWLSCSGPAQSEPEPAAPAPAPSADSASAPDDEAIVIRPRALVAPDSVPEEVQAFLAERMQRHGRDTADLLYSVVLLDYPGVARGAARLSQQPRATPQESALQASFPETFFDLHGDLIDVAGRLETAAVARDPHQVAAEFSVMVETCVDCHALFTRPAQPAL